MGIIVNKENNKNDELSRRISADLRARAQSGMDVRANGASPDLADDAEYMKDLKKTSKFGGIWIVLIVLAILSVLSMIFI